jgi:hypothetical protein
MVRSPKDVEKVREISALFTLAPAFQSSQPGSTSLPVSDRSTRNGSADAPLAAVSRDITRKNRNLLHMIVLLHESSM